MTNATNTMTTAKATFLLDGETSYELYPTMARALADAFGSVAELGYEVGQLDLLDPRFVGADIYSADGVRVGSVMVYTFPREWDTVER